MSVAALPAVLVRWHQTFLPLLAKAVYTKGSRQQSTQILGGKILRCVHCQPQRRRTVEVPGRCHHPCRGCCGWGVHSLGTRAAHSSGVRRITQQTAIGLGGRAAVVLVLVAGAESVSVLIYLLHTLWIWFGN